MRTPSLTPWLLPVALFMACAFASPGVASAQELLRLDFDEPQIMLATHGRTGACDSLQFSKDGRELFGVGDDKRVHRWSVLPERGLQYATPLHWNVFRERRGAIYAMALSPNEEQIAIAGLGRKEADVVVLDRRTGQVVASLSVESHPETYVPANHNVWSLAFNASGSHIAIGHDDGSVWLWAPEGPGRGKVQAIAAPVEDPEQRSNRQAKCLWVGFHEDRIRFVRGNGTAWEATAKSPPREIFRFTKPVAQVVSPPGGKFLAACPLAQDATGSRIELRALPTGEVLGHIPFEQNEKNEQAIFPVSLALNATGTHLAVGTKWVLSAYRYSGRPPGDIRVYHLKDQQPTLESILVCDGQENRPVLVADALAFAPNGDLAIAGGEHHQTSLWKRNAATLVPVGAPSISVGRSIWQVATGNEGKVLYFQQNAKDQPQSPNERGTGPWRAFNLETNSWLPAGDEPTERPVEELNGWKIEIHPSREFEWTAVNGEFRYPIPVNKARDDRPMCYTFLPSPNPRWTRLAIGYYWGFKVFDLRRGFTPQLVARGVGHQGPVTSISPARNGQMLMTASSDQVIAIWSLQPWDHHPILGASMDWVIDPKTQQRAFQVLAVKTGSPAWEAGLLAGDRIVQLGYHTGWVNNPADWEKTIASVQPDHELAMIIQRSQGPGQKPIQKGVKTNMLTRPQARFFPTVDHDWVLYRYADYFYSCSTNGDNYLGWLVAGQLAADTPAYFPASRFESVFHRPNAVRDAVVDLIRDPQRPLTRNYLPPQVVATIDRTETVDAPVKIDVTVSPRQDITGKVIPIEKVELWLDDEVLLHEWPGSGVNPLKESLVIQAARLRVGKNQLNVVAHARTRGELGLVVDHQPKLRRLAKLRGIAVGVDQYPYLSPENQLTAAANDAQLIKEGLESLERIGAVSSAKIDLLINEQATPQNIINAIEKANQELAPDDWFVVFLAGHGFVELDIRAGQPRQVRPGTWFFCASLPATDAPAAPAGTKGAGERQILDPKGLATQRDVDQFVGNLRDMNCIITGKQLLANLAKLNCRKLVLLDSCHSGAAIEQDPSRDLRPDGKGAVIMTASAPDETASEFNLTVRKGETEVQNRHGFFTAAVFQTLTTGRAEADRNGDGILTLEELHIAVARNVRETRSQVGLDRKGQRTQTVLTSPPELRDLIFVHEK